MESKISGIRLKRHKCLFLIFLIFLSGTFLFSEDNDRKIQYGETFRFLVGSEFTRASNADVSSRWFADLYFSQKFPYTKKQNNRNCFWDKMRIWGNIRLTSVPVNNEMAIGAVSEYLETGMSKLKIREIVQSGEFLSGLEYRITEGESEGYKRTLSLLFSAGASSNETKNENPSIFSIGEKKSILEEKYKDDGYNFDEYEAVAFVNPDRKSFFAQWYLGFRLKSYLLSENGESFPRMFDFLIGQNTAVNPSKEYIVRIDGFIPIEIAGIPLYFMGNVIVNLKKGHSSCPLYLPKAPENITMFSNKVLEIEVQRIPHDYFKVGIGVNLIKLLNNLKKIKEKVNPVESDQESSENTGTEQK